VSDVVDCDVQTPATSLTIPINNNNTHTHTHTHPFNGPFSGTTQVSQYQKGKTNLDFIEARDSEWQWHQLGHMQVCTSLQTDNHASTPPLSFLKAGCPSCRQTNSVKALQAINNNNNNYDNVYGAIMMTKVIARVHPVHLNNVD